MLTDLKVKVGPQFYQYYPGILEKVPQFFEEYKAKNILIVHGDTSWQIAKPYMTFLEDESFSYDYYQYAGECSYKDGEHIKTLTEQLETDFIIGIGGGKLCDLVKLSSHLTKIPYGLIPTLASNCAPWTPLSVMYRENGESEGVIEFFNHQAAFLLAEPDLLLTTPERYFVAGIIDTMAKWYEADAILNQAEYQGENFLRIAQFITQDTKDILARDAEIAIDSLRKQTFSDEFYRVSEIIFAIAGLVGSLGDGYARSAAAHSLHDGLCKYCPEMKDYYHGEIVGYGMMYQMAIEDRYDEVSKLRDFYQKMNSPISLKEMGVELTDELLDTLAEYVNEEPNVHRMPGTITKDLLRQSLIDLEKFVTSGSTH